MIEAENLSVMRGGKAILRGLDLLVKPGQLTAIAGPNGSGKSTLLKAIAGELPYKGSLTLLGREIAAYPPERLAVLRGVLPQSSEVAFPFTVSDIVGLGLETGGRGRRPDAAQRISEALFRVGLTGFGHRNYMELSGGEQQRTQLARVLCQIPEPVSAEAIPSLLLLDEPVASLDIRHQLEIMELARAYARQGAAVVAVMHDLNLTSLFADRLLLMRDGQLVVSGPVCEVVTDALLEKVYGCRLRVNAIPPSGVPFVLAQCAG